MKKLKSVFWLVFLSGCSSAPLNQSRITASRDDVVVRIESMQSSAPQSTKGIENTDCGKLIAQSQPTGRTVYLANVLGVPHLDDPAYQEFRASSGVSCFKLVRNGSNDAAWGLGASRAFGCICGNIAR